MLAITDHTYIIYDGKMLIEGDSHTIANDPQVRKFFSWGKIFTEPIVSNPRSHIFRRSTFAGSSTPKGETTNLFS
jgi:hypothetical protein